MVCVYDCARISSSLCFSVCLFPSLNRAVDSLWKCGWISISWSLLEWFLLCLWWRWELQFTVGVCVFFTMLSRKSSKFLWKHKIHHSTCCYAAAMPCVSSICSIVSFPCPLCCSVSSGCVLSHFVALVTTVDVALKEGHLAVMCSSPGLCADLWLSGAVFLD